MKGPSAGVSLTQHQRKTGTVIQKQNKKNNKKAKLTRCESLKRLLKNNVEKELTDFCNFESALFSCLDTIALSF